MAIEAEAEPGAGGQQAGAAAGQGGEELLDRHAAEVAERDHLYSSWRFHHE
jgi:hypothetical protein